MQDKYGFFDIQKQIQEWWEKKRIYLTKKNDSQENFVIDTPPPTVSGKLHIGHIFSYTHQDFIARYKRMNGYRVIYPFGFDDNGLPTERYVEKKRNISSHKFEREEFRKICANEITPLHTLFVDLWKKIGLSCDWNLVYSTISDNTKKLSQESFIDLYKKGYIYKKLEPALYCTATRTSISQADLEEIEKKSYLNTITFFESTSNSILPIATTRPELLGGCVAVLIHPEDTRYQHLIGKFAKVPLYNHIVPIIADELVLPEKGTGIVMSATFGDTLDITWFKKHSFSYKKILNQDGTISEIGLFLKGLKVEEARKKVIEKLIEKNLLLEKKEIIHKISVYERSKKEVEYIPLDQWFIKIIPFKEKLIELGNSITWYPAYMKYRYDDWVKNLSWDWCISRQRSFGIPFPVWYTQDGKIIVADKSQLPIDPLITQPLNYTEIVTGDSDVMDTWNTSSLTPYIIQDIFEKKYDEILSLPFSIRPQSHDIIRTWAFDTIVKSFFTDNIIPWENIVISGHVLSANHEKISKSKGNSSYEPEELLNTYPADAIRYWAAQVKLGIDATFSETQFKDGNKLIIKLINAGICIKDFAYFTIKSFTVEEYNNVIISYFIDCFEETKRKYHDAFSKFDFSGALRIIEDFFWLFCDYFLEIIKIYHHEKIENNSELKKLKHITGFLFYEIILYFAPFLPFITEHLFHLYYNNESSIHQESLTINNNNTQKNISNHSSSKKLIEIISIVRKIKSELKVSLKTPIDNLTISFQSDSTYTYYNSSKELLFIIEKLLVVKKINVTNYHSEDQTQNHIHSYNFDKNIINQITIQI